MSPFANRILFALAVLSWGAVLLYFYASGRIVAYLAPDFRPLALAGGLGLSVLGLFNLLTADQKADCGHDHDHGEEDDEPHNHEKSDLHPLLAFALMVVPIGLSVAWTKDEYSSAALARKGLFDAPSQIATPFMASSLGPLTLEDIQKSHRQTEDGFYQFNLLELFFATGDRELQSLIDGMKVETEGRWMHERDDPRGTRKRLFRLFITCCAADSRAIPIVLEFGKTPPEFPEQGWVKVAGVMRFPLENGLMQPVLEVERALAAEPPFEESFMRN
jgi:uncharacterized repeat protein (TIGR03943 family)